MPGMSRQANGADARPGGRRFAVGRLRPPRLRQPWLVDDRQPTSRRSLLSICSSGEDLAAGGGSRLRRQPVVFWVKADAGRAGRAGSRTHPRTPAFRRAHKFRRRLRRAIASNRSATFHCSVNWLSPLPDRIDSLRSLRRTTVRGGLTPSRSAWSTADIDTSQP